VLRALKFALPVSIAFTALGGVGAALLSHWPIASGLAAVALGLVAPALVFAWSAPQLLSSAGIPSGDARTVGRIVAFAMPAAPVLGALASYLGVAVTGRIMEGWPAVALGIGLGYLAGAAAVCAAAAAFATLLLERPTGRI